jgi:DNA-binding response OmpR family regulator
MEVSMADMVLIATTEPDLPTLLRQARSLAPLSPKILVWKPGGSVEQAICALNSGADDYIYQDSGFGELFGRVRAVLRGRKRPGSPFHRPLADGLVLDLLLGTIASNDHAPLSLTTTQCRLLFELSHSDGRVISRDDLIEGVFGESADVLDRVIDNQVARLRKRLRMIGADRLIETCRGEGYRLCVNGARLGS